MTHGSTKVPQNGHGSKVLPLLVGDFSTMSDWLSGILSFITLSAIGIVIGLASASIMVTPLAVKFISERYFPHLEKRGQHANTVSTFNAVKVSLIFVFGWLLTLPLWFIPFMSIVLSIFWGAYAFSQMSQVDAIVEHATAEERRYILSNHKKRLLDYWSNLCRPIAYSFHGIGYARVLYYCMHTLWT